MVVSQETRPTELVGVARNNLRQQGGESTVGPRVCQITHLNRRPGLIVPPNEKHATILGRCWRAARVQGLVVAVSQRRMMSEPILSRRNRQLSEIRAPRHTLGIGGPSLGSQLVCGRLWSGLLLPLDCRAQRCGSLACFRSSAVFSVRCGASLHRPTASRDIRPRSGGGDRSLVVW